MNSFSRHEVNRFARLDPAMFNKDVALFQPLARDGVSRLKASEWTTFYENETIKVVSPYRLGADDLGLLLALISFGGQRTVAKMLSRKTTCGTDSRSRLISVPARRSSMPHIRIRTTINDVLLAVRLPRKSNIYEQAKEKLQRLSAVKCFREGVVGNRRVSMSTGEENLLGYNLTEDGNLTVTISERLTQAILGKHFIRVDIPSYQRLRGDTARILLVRLCAIIREGGTGKRALNDLAHLVYGEPSGKAPWTESQVKERRRMVREALKEIEERLEGWKVAVDDKDRFCITRPSNFRSARRKVPSDMQELV